MKEKITAFWLKHWLAAYFIIGLILPGAWAADIDVNGNLGVSGSVTANSASVTGNVQAGSFTGNGSGLQGIYATTTMMDGDGVFGQADNGTTAYGLHGVSAEGYGVYGYGGNYGGYFSGPKTYVSGNLGVGDATPDYKLDVTGTANLNNGVSSGVALRVNGAEALWYDGTYFSWGYGATDNYFADPVYIGITPLHISVGLYVDAYETGIKALGSRIGVLGISNSSDAIGVWGYSDFGKAGVFSGNVEVTGNVTKAGGSFKIDHPLDPANKYLYHSFVESPDMMNIYNGNVVLDAYGEAVVKLPNWFEALNSDYRYQLTAVGQPGPNLYVAQEISNGQFTIAGGAPGMKVSWQVTGIRQDAYANAHRIPVEEEKPDDERGTYLHPELFKQPVEKGVEWALKPEVMRSLYSKQKQP